VVAPSLHRGIQVIRRRYGTVSQQDGLKLKYHEYNLVNTDSAGKLADSKGCTLFHLLPDAASGEGGAAASTNRGASAAGPIQGEKRKFGDVSPAGAANPIKTQRNSVGGDDNSPQQRGGEQAGPDQPAEGWNGADGGEAGRSRAGAIATTAGSGQWMDSQSQVATVRNYPAGP
jgi:hypothetical protein